ncbi:LamG domain-containing protein [Streptomyces sp. NPDC005968]|uniref:LamG domain-containing protein n=1 Tax=Streptomyces sp. NPDC005968 TaxID=3154574 RepID=UPI0034110443
MRTTVAGALSGLLLGGLPVLPLAPAAAAPSQAASAASAATQASAQAVATGKPVEVVAERTEYSTTYANPDGSTFNLKQSAVPVRVAQPSGAWATPDATLTRREDHRIAPKAAVAGVSFSGGGDGTDLVSIAEDGHTLTVGWPGSLPAPTLDGDSAIYANVLPDVDLRMTATTEGYREVLVVKTAQAAANPALTALHLPVRADGLVLREGAGQSLQAVDDNGATVFRAPTARQWDSTGHDGTTAPAAQTKPSGSSSAKTASAPSTNASAETPDSQAAGSAAEGDESGVTDPAEGPGDGATAVPLDMSLTQSAITVVPDAGELKDEDTVYPLYIDPDVSWSESERTVLSSDGDTFYNFSGGDEGKGVGLCSIYYTGGFGYPCTTGTPYKQRMYFEFAPSALKGKRVLDATFRVTERWSMSCTATVVQLVRTGDISSSTRWPGPTANWDVMGDRTVSAGRGSDCSPSQPAKPIEFNDDPSQSYENLTKTVQSFAAGDMSRLTLMIKAGDEGDPNGWKRFDDDAVLDVDYVGVPAPPTGPGVLSGSGTTCETAESDPAIISDPTPDFLTTVQTESGGESGATLRAHFVVQKKNSDGSWATATEPVRPSSGFVTDNAKVQVTSPVTFADGTLARMSSWTRSYWSGDDHMIESTHSSVTTKGWCYFKVDTTAPKAPTVTTDGMYSLCTANACAAGGGPGQGGNFYFKPATGDTNIAGYEYRLPTWPTWHSVTGSAPTKLITPELPGTQTLQVRAKDNVGSGRPGATTSFLFKVAEGEGASGRWHFDDAAPGSGVVTAADSATTAGTRHPLTFHTAGAGFSSLARRGEQDRSFWLDSNVTANQTAWADTSSPAINTQASFSVSTWAYLTEDTDFHCIASQQNSDNTGWSLYYSSGVQRWVFLWSWYENGARKYIGANASAQGVPLKAWTHVGGVYNATDRTITLYVNGRPQGAPAALGTSGKPTTSDGALQIGRAGYSGGFNNYWRGRIDEVAVFQRALSDSEMAQEAGLIDPDTGSTAVELVGAWDPDGATGSTLPDSVSGYSRTMALSGGATLDGEAVSLDGVDDAATVSGPVVDDTGSFTVTTEVELDGAALAGKSAGYSGQVVGQRTADGSAWGLWFNQTGTEQVPQDDGTLKDVPVGYWRFGRLAADGRTYTAVSSESTALTDERVRLTGAYNAQDGTISLYLDATPNDVPTAFTAVAGNGDFSAGRAYVNKAWGNYLPEKISDLRIWVGAPANDMQVENMIGG